MRRQVKSGAVKRELLQGESTKLLQELHLLTREGNLNADSLRKLKQVNHLVQLLQPAVEDVLERFGDPVVVDCGAGKGYLGFIFYELFLAKAEKGRILAIEGREELVRAARERADRLGFSRMELVHSRLEEAMLPPRLHLVTALHACDTATDDALFLAIRGNADHVAVVPCCQAEVAAQLKERKAAEPPISSLFSHPWHRREFGSHLTNVLRALTLEAHGYSVTVTELTGWEHSLKNELIVGRKVRGSNPAARKELDSLLAATGVQPKLHRLLAG
ncbi:class I SAM-dependent methyltransferase [Vulgatibacter incomptus]|uniref:SAM-dependent methyltransferase n=1 Tax=Vulgatibacter incomptus TaxID=1391653 RepID=A0A0K1PG10_9BACT|nr:SAM-dependent methyltransferase [Vulgatibacter incomptus]AKU92049.1 SAM-dependent methyltransferase [Vulgatibacter incomptus]